MGNTDTKGWITECTELEPAVPYTQLLDVTVTCLYPSWQIPFCECQCVSVLVLRKFFAALSYVKVYRFSKRVPAFEGLQVARVCVSSVQLCARAAHAFQTRVDARRKAAVPGHATAPIGLTVMG